MTLRDRMVYAGLRTSRRFARLSWIQRDFFQGLLHVADDLGRFEADAGMLRTVLYGPLLAKVSERDVAQMLVQLHHVELVKLYTVQGRGYGKVINFRQTGLKTRRALYPDEDGPPDAPELFTPPAALTVSAPSERKKEAPHSPPPGGGRENASLVTETRASPRASPVRFRRAERLDTLNDERERIEGEMQEILRPGGCAYNVTPTGEKAIRFEKLKTAHNELMAMIGRRRTELATVTER